MTCEDCGGTGIFLSQPHDTLGLPNGWVQKCDACNRYASDLAAMNAHRAARGLPPMSHHPFDVVDREDAAPGSPVEQEFLLDGLLDGRPPETAYVTVRNEGELWDADSLEEALRELFADWLYAAGVWRGGPDDPALVGLTVVDCGPCRGGETP